MLSADKKNGIMKAMETIIKKIDKNQIDEDAIREAGEILREGGLVAFPTETVYGLGANALDEEAAKKTYEAKGRPSDNPLIVHIADLEDLSEITENVPPETELLAKHFWPGPLTMIFEKSSLVPYGTTGGLDTVAVRMPSDLIARKLILAAGGYVSAPSANTSGRPSPTTAEHVWEDLRPLGRDVILQHFPHIYKQCKDEGYDVLVEPIPVVPAQHYHMGGVKADLAGRTSMEGLYAVGEAGCNGVHGRNRLASNSLLESLVFAQRAADDIMFSREHRGCGEDNIDLSEYEDIDGLFREYKNIVLTETERRG